MAVAAEGARRELGALLQACVQDGASIGFVLPFAVDDSEAFWREKVLPEEQAGRALRLSRRPPGEKFA